MRLGDFLNKLEKVRRLSTGEYEARCPSHEDRKPSLSVKAEGERLLVNCHTGCTVEAITAALGLTVADLFLESKAQVPKSAPTSQIVATYSYTDEAGEELFQVVRLKPKSFRQRHKNGSGEWAWNLDGVRRVLYHLPDVVKAESLYLVEGEKDADNLRALGLQATTSPGGAQAWRPEYAQCLAGKSITLLPDTDGPGLGYACDVAEALEGKAQLKVILLPPPAKDVSDWLEAGGDVKTLPDMAQEIASLYTAKVEHTGPEVIVRGRVYLFSWASEHVIVTVDRLAEERHIISAEVMIGRGNTERHTRLARARINLLSTQGRSSLVKYLSSREPSFAHTWDSMVQKACDETVDRFREGDDAVELWTPEEALPRQEYLLWPLFPLDQPSLLFGEGDSGKSFLVLFCYVIIGLAWADNPLGLRPGLTYANGLYLDWETTEREILARLDQIKGGFGLGALSLNYRACRRPLAADIDGIQRMIIKNQANFLVIDSVAAACGGDINSPQPVEEFYGALRELKGFSQEHISSIIIGHTSKDPLSKRKSPFGSAFFFNYARSVTEVKRSDSPGDTLRMTLTCRKANNARRFDPLGFELAWTDQGVTIAQIEPQSPESLPDDIGAGFRILQAVKSSGAATNGRLVTLTGLKPRTVEGTTARLASKGLLLNVGHEGRAILWDCPASLDLDTLNPQNT